MFWCVFQGLKDAVGLEPERGAVKYIIHTKVMYSASGN